MLDRIAAAALIFTATAAPALAGIAAPHPGLPEPATMTLFGLGIGGAYIAQEIHQPQIAERGPPINKEVPLLDRIVATALIFTATAAPAFAGFSVAPRLPEPATMTLFGLGIGGAYLARKFTRRK